MGEQDMSLGEPLVIKSISVTNFGPLEQVELELGKINLFIGEAGLGKSWALIALEFLTEFSQATTITSKYLRKGSASMAVEIEWSDGVRGCWRYQKEDKDTLKRTQSAEFGSRPPFTGLVHIQGYPGTPRTWSPSMGEKKMTAFRRSLGALPENGILTLENPEAFLSRRFQEQVVQELCALIRIGNHQILVETHGLFFYLALKKQIERKGILDADVVVHSFEPGGKVTRTDCASLMGWSL